MSRCSESDLDWYIDYQNEWKQDQAAESEREQEEQRNRDIDDPRHDRFQ